MIQQITGLNFFSEVQQAKLKILDNIIDNNNNWEELIFQTKNQDVEDLQIYGFKSDGGIDACELSYWVDKMFTQNMSGVCTDEGQNFNVVGHIQGVKRVFSKEVVEKSDLMLEKLSNALLINSTHSLSLKKQMMIRMIGEGTEQQTKQFINSFRFFIQMSEEETDKALDYLFNQNYKQKENLNLKCYKTNQYYRQNQNTVNQKVLKSLFLEEDVDHDQIQKTIGVSKSLKIYRNSDTHYNCPVKTLAAFSSLKYVDIEKEDLLTQFNDVNSVDKIVDLVQKLNLNVALTNIQQLKNKSINFGGQYDMENVPYVLFQNNNQQTNISPILWIQFTNNDIPKIEIQFPKYNFFSGSYFVGKLIDCKDMINQNYEDEEHEDTNIDIGYLTFQGYTLQI